MNLREAVAICKEKSDGRIPIAGYETEHFYVFSSLAYRRDDPLGGSPMFAIDKETGDTGFLISDILAYCDPTLDSGWGQFKQYDSDELIRELEEDPEFEEILKEYK